jgi:hypothetical protein
MTATHHPNAASLMRWLKAPLAVFAEGLRNRTLPVASSEWRPTGDHWSELAEVHVSGEEDTLRTLMLDATLRGRPLHLQRTPHHIVIWQGPAGSL